MTGDQHPAEAELGHHDPWADELAATDVAERRTALAVAHALALAACGALLVGMVLWLPIGDSALSDTVRWGVWWVAGLTWGLHGLLSSAVVGLLVAWPGIHSPEEARAAVAVGHGAGLVVESALVVAAVFAILG